MGGAASLACQSGGRSVNKWLIPSIGRFAVIGCSLQVASSCKNIEHAQYYANAGCKSCASLRGLLASVIVIVRGAACLNEFSIITRLILTDCDKIITL